MNAHPLSLIDDNEDNSSQTHVSSSKYKKSIKEDDTSTENTLNNQKRYIFREKYENNQKFQKPKVNQKIIFDFKNKFTRDNSIISKNTSDLENKQPGLIDDSNENENTKKENIENNIKNNFNKEDNINVPNDLKNEKLAKNLIEKRDKRFSYHGKIYFFCAISMLLYQYISYIYLIEFPIIQRK